MCQFTNFEKTLSIINEISIGLPLGLIPNNQPFLALNIF